MKERLNDTLNASDSDSVSPFDLVVNATESLNDSYLGDLGLLLEVFAKKAGKRKGALKSFP